MSENEDQNQLVRSVAIRSLVGSSNLEDVKPFLEGFTSGDCGSRVGIAAQRTLEGKPFGYRQCVEEFIWLDWHSPYFY